MGQPIPLTFYDQVKYNPMDKKQLYSSKEYKTISVGTNGMSVVYTDTNKHFNYKFDKSIREDILYGKSLGDVKASDVKDFLNPHQRQLFNDLLYSKGRYTEQEIKKLPVIRQYYITELAEKVDKVLYNWKRDLINERVDSTLLKLFPNSKIVKQLIEICKENRVGMDATRVDIRNLVSEKEIVTYLQTKGLFPSPLKDELS